MNHRNMQIKLTLSSVELLLGSRTPHHAQYLCDLFRGSLVRRRLVLQVSDPPLVSILR